MREIQTVEELEAHVAHIGGLANVVIQGVDLSAHTELLLSVSCADAVFLGASLAPEALAHVFADGAVAFPRIPDLPFDVYRPRLYAQHELFSGWVAGCDGSFADSADSKIYRWAARHPKGPHLPIVDALAQRLHDHAIDDALGEHLESHPDVVAVIGGHGMLRDQSMYETVAELGRSMARVGWHVATGGGPGAMEAANLGAWLAPYDDAALGAALDLLAKAPDFHHVDSYLTASQAVLDKFPEGSESLAVPTWFYGHEPTNRFATHIAKYFANSIREDGLLAIATRGVVFAPGAAGTTQEVFQDATQNHYAVFETVSPMVFLGSRHWQHDLPAEPLLRRLAEGRPYADLIGVADTAPGVMDFLLRHQPTDG